MNGDEGTMNTPTTCSQCGKVWPIDKMTRDSEGYWYCPCCEQERLRYARGAIRRLQGKPKP